MNQIRRWMTLCEAALTEAGKVVYTAPTDDGKRFVIIRDPTVQQFNTILTNARYRLVRMLCKDQHIYCWDGYYADHDIAALAMGFRGGPFTIGIRLEATSEFVNYGHRISVDLRGTEYGPRNYSAVRDVARQAAATELTNMLNEYPQLNNLVGNLPTSIECTATFDNDMESYRDMLIGPLNSFLQIVRETVADRTAPITPREFHKAMREAINLFKTFAWCKSMRDINEGDCGSFVGEVMEHLGMRFYERTADLQPNSTKWYLDANDQNLDLPKVRSLGEPVPDDIPDDRLAYELGSIHYWLTYHGRHYDAEALKGVDHFLDLPHFQRIIARLRGQPVTPSTRE